MCYSRLFLFCFVFLSVFFFEEEDFEAEWRIHDQYWLPSRVSCEWAGTIFQGAGEVMANADGQGL